MISCGKSLKVIAEHRDCLFLKKKLRQQQCPLLRRALFLSSSESVFHISTVIAKVVRMYRNESNEDYTLQECVLFMVDPTVKVQHTPTLPLLVDKKSEASIVVTIRWVDSSNDMQPANIFTSV